MNPVVGGAGLALNVVFVVCPCDFDFFGVDDSATIETSREVLRRGTLRVGEFMDGSFSVWGRRAPSNGENGVVAGFFSTFGTPICPPLPTWPVVLGTGLALKGLYDDSMATVGFMDIPFVLTGASFDAISWRRSLAEAIDNRCSLSLAAKESRDRATLSFRRCAAPRSLSMKAIDEASRFFFALVRSL
jgi:hypothetical protein